MRTYAGIAKIADTPKKTNYFWGDISEIAGKEIPVIERNLQGDCLCIVENIGLVDVDHEDVVSYTETPDVVKAMWDFIGGK